MKLPAPFGVALQLLLLVALYNTNVDQMMGEKGRLLAKSRRRRMIGWAFLFQLSARDGLDVGRSFRPARGSISGRVREIERLARAPRKRRRIARKFRD